VGFLSIIFIFHFLFLGGAILFSGNSFHDDSSVFVNNTASECGAISMTNSGNLTRSVFSANTAVNGGALCVFYNAYLVDCSFVGNNATSGTGGAIYAFNGDPATVFMDGCTLKSNTAATG
jgi:predicted outer membrane repeat protein